MKAQATVEFLGTFLLTIAFFSAVIAGMASLKGESEYSAYVMELTAELEGIARALDSYSNCGIAMTFDLETGTNRIQNSTVLAEDNGRTLVIGGVFDGGADHAEPI